MPVNLVVKGDRLVVKSWCANPDSQAIEQAKNLASLPFAYHHICLMPDTHVGYGMPIGGILATEDVIVPNAVGVDIGCGMIAVNTHIPVPSLSIDTLKHVIMGHIRKTVPVGFNKHEKMQDLGLLPSLVGDMVVAREIERSRHQLGTLGGGNHFIEIQRDEQDNVWIMIHSGSRNLGKQICDHYDGIAKELNKKWASSIPPSWDLAFFPVDYPAARAYIAEMTYAVEWALANRMLMYRNVAEGFRLAGFDPSSFDTPINIPHNWAALEKHYGKDVWVHRKGATRAFAGEKGIIPGSQGTHSYIVEGLGNPESFMSCSHGAGRVLGRAQAQKTLDLATEIKRLDDMGVVHGVRTVKDLDEAPGAYKDIDTVMKEQEDLVRIIVKLSPMAVVKG